MIIALTVAALFSLAAVSFRKMRRGSSRSSFRSRVSYRPVASPAPNQKNQEEERGQWNSKADYLFTCIGYAVGLGNICRFPYLAYENGGGAFVIPYVIMLILVGIPIVFMETSMGQYSAKGPIKVWSMCPIFGGIGVAQIILVFYVGIYYNVIVSYAIFFLFASFDSAVPWANCDNWWNTEKCVEPGEAAVFQTQKVVGCQITYKSLYDLFTREAYEVIQILNDNFGRSTTEGWFLMDDDLQTLDDIDSKISQKLQSTCTSTLSSTPAEEYMEQYVLGLADNFSFLQDPVRWQNTLVFALAWLLVYAVLMNGIKEAGKIIWFTALFPYVVLTIFLIRGATLEGASLGLKYYLGSESDFAKLGRGSTWKNAATQILFSTSAAQGGMITLASYSQFKNNNLGDTLIICVVNSLTSIYGGLVVFSILGFMATQSNVPLAEVVRSGITLTFVSFPAAIAQMPGSSLWSVVFFFMVLILGLDTQFTVVEICTTAIMDGFSQYLTPSKHQRFVSAGLCFLFFLLGLPLMTGSGVYWIVLLDDFAGSWGLIILALFEVVAVSWFYGCDKFIDDVRNMLPEEKTFGLDLKNSWINWLVWKILWKFVTPITLFVILIWSLIDIKPSQYGNYIFPTWAQTIGWLVLFSGLIFVFVIILLRLCTEYRISGSIKQAFLDAKEPSDEWKPADNGYTKPVVSGTASPTNRLDAIDETAPFTSGVSSFRFEPKSTSRLSNRQYFDPKPMASPMV